LCLRSLQFAGEVCGKAEEAISFYTSVFNSAPDAADAGETKTAVVARYGNGEDPEGTVRYASRRGVRRDGFRVAAPVPIQRGDIVDRAM
jgi:hypothetical protein